MPSPADSVLAKRAERAGAKLFRMGRKARWAAVGLRKAEARRDRARPLRRTGQQRNCINCIGNGHRDYLFSIVDDAKDDRWEWREERMDAEGS